MDSDVTVDHPEAWLIDDRRISFALDAELSLPDVAAHQRILEEIGKLAISGDAFLDVEGQDRWALRFGTNPSDMYPLPAKAPARVSSVDSTETADTDITAIRHNNTGS